MLLRTGSLVDDAEITTAGLNIDNISNKKQRSKSNYWKSMKEFVRKHRNSVVDAAPSKRRCWQRDIEMKYTNVESPTIFCYENVVNLHMCELKTKKHVVDEFRKTYTVINVPTYFRIH